MLLVFDFCKRLFSLQTLNAWMCNFAASAYLNQIKKDPKIMARALTSFGLLLSLSLGVWANDGASRKPLGSWITGTWAGTGYQIDDNSTWTMRLTAHSGKFSIAYPSLNCGGEWVLQHHYGNKAVFRERLSYGQDKCTDDSTVVIERLSNKQLVVLFTNPGDSEVNSSGILNRQPSGDPLMKKN